jgi:hypothetical protein
MEQKNPLKTIKCPTCNIEKSITSFTYNSTSNYTRKICKVCIQKGLTMKDVKITEDRCCEACEVVKPINQFYRNNALIDGYERRCKMCKINRVKINKNEPKYPNRKPYQQEWENYFNLVGVTKNNYRSMYIFLEGIGYDLSQNIHEQFCKKWNITYSPLKKPFNNHFSPEDCDIL